MNCMATIKHTSSKNSDLTAPEHYLTFQHNEYTGLPILDENGQPIEGFYAVGNCSGPFYGSVDYPLDIPGLSISRAITLGYVVGKTLSQS